MEAQATLCAVADSDEHTPYGCSARARDVPQMHSDIALSPKDIP